ncbi:DEAD/DEAH box helicase family protein [Massilia sp. P8910]|uniref:DEAD/DEAH box helicase family protein n=1 Tax=Massilia antarctica TaxID=2765360 RepID=UPI001E530DCB|nr:DEAD/DEAH box helicase family protein [Massilia antarctica]MCE3608090.1 DEAD/DEAH box helicase family protein [Massilia antarctica]
MLELKVFQSNAAKSISDRFAFFANHEDRPRKGKKPRPYFQALSALTGAGKTPILAESVAQMRAHFGCEPIVFWMSKAKSVVAQTYTNFSGGGKYSQIIDGFKVINVSQLIPDLIQDSSTPLLVMATTGLFNNKDQSAGALHIYKQDADLFGDKSPWQRLIERSDGEQRRPLIIVYDEGHNLSDQQTEILGELEPDAYLLASATLKLPDNFNKSVVQPIRLWVEEAEDVDAFLALGAVNEDGAADPRLFITTAVNSQAVVDAELVKKAIQFDGTTSTMETSLDDLMVRMQTLEEEIAVRELGFKPKAIYVCKTNMNDDGGKDNHADPFEQRSAPPIKIWRHLVEQRGVDPKTIAIYANLSFLEGNKPDEVNLFSKGENDFDDFSAGDFQHIIFNLALQEGWDDPACYLAYIDKSMGSSIQVEQIIGRVLRQPKAKHYDNPLLNSAHFFLRVDKKSVFEASINAVKEKLQSEGAPIEIVGNFGNSGGGAEDLLPKEGVEVELCHIHADAEAACERIADIIASFPTFAEGGVDAVGQAHTAKELVDLTKLEGEPGQTTWTAAGSTNPVRLRWFMESALRMRSKGAKAATDFQHKKFDVRVQVNSNAHKAADKMAVEIAEAYYDLTELVYESLRPFKFGTMRVPKTAPAFNNALYERYNGFNKFELPFAHALDETNHTWHRNPSNGGFHIPLLTDGDTSSFFPDFILWKGDKIFCLDTKGSHLLTDAVARKLFDIQEDGKTKLQVRFITEGKQTELRGKIIKGGYTIWKMKNGSPVAIHFDDLQKAIKECIK